MSPSAAIWLLIEAEFLAIVLVLVYVGAVMVLFLFVVMMLDINVEKLREGFTRFACLAGWPPRPGSGDPRRRQSWARAPTMDGVRPRRRLQQHAELGPLLYTKYLYPFELAAMLLLVAIVAAIVLTLRHRKGLKLQDINAQVAARRRTGCGSSRSTPRGGISNDHAVST